MSQIRNCNIPEDLYYVVEKHVWARYDGELVTVGMTDVAQHLAHTFLSVTAKAPGRTVKKAKSIATVESSKWVGPVPSPVEGEVVEINAAVVAGSIRLGVPPPKKMEPSVRRPSRAASHASSCRNAAPNRA